MKRLFLYITGFILLASGSVYVIGQSIESASDHLASAAHSIIPTLTRETVRERIVMALSKETASSFLITGALDLTSSISSTSSSTFLPGFLNVSLGSSSANLRVPGKASYGFEIASIKPENIKIRKNGEIDLILPELLVYSVEPDLASLELNGERGWARSAASVEERKTSALRLVNYALRNQAEQHLASSDQPMMNSAKVIEAILVSAIGKLGPGSQEIRVHYTLPSGAEVLL